MYSDKPTDNIEEIEKYVHGRLSEAEAYAFEQRLAIDTDLSEELESYRMAMKSVEHDAVRQKLDQFHQELKTPERSSVNIWKYLTGFAATVIVFLSAGYWYTNQAVDSAGMVDRYFVPYENIVNVRDGAKSDLSQAMTLYSSGKYREALAAFDESALSEEHLVIRQFYSGVSHLALGQSAEAISALSTLRNSEFSQQARWYLALSYLQKGDLALTKSTLLQIEASQYQYEEAQQVLEAL